MSICWTQSSLVSYSAANRERIINLTSASIRYSYSTMNSVLIKKCKSLKKKPLCGGRDLRAW